MSQTSVSPEKPRSNVRRVAFLILGVVVLIAGAIYGAIMIALDAMDLRSVVKRRLARFT